MKLWDRFSSHGQDTEQKLVVLLGFHLAQVLGYLLQGFSISKACLRSTVTVCLFCSDFIEISFAVLKYVLTSKQCFDHEKAPRDRSAGKAARSPPKSGCNSVGFRSVPALILVMYWRWRLTLLQCYESRWFLYIMYSNSRKYLAKYEQTRCFLLRFLLFPFSNADMFDFQR